MLNVFSLFYQLLSDLLRSLPYWTRWQAALSKMFRFFCDVLAQLGAGSLTESAETLSCTSIL